MTTSSTSSTTTTSTTTATPKTAARPTAAQFSARELASHALDWGVRPAMIRAAFRTAGQKRVSLVDAEKLVKDFASREI